MPFQRGETGELERGAHIAFGSRRSFLDCQVGDIRISIDDRFTTPKPHSQPRNRVAALLKLLLALPFSDCILSMRTERDWTRGETSLKHIISKYQVNAPDLGAKMRDDLTHMMLHC